MIPWEHLGTAQVPDDGGELKLMRRGQEFSIFAGPIELMSSRLSGSEEALALLTCERLISRPAPRVLIGGLGMGFTLRTALHRLGPDARIVLAELVPEVVDWARGPVAALHGDSLDDPRVRIHVGDVAQPIAEGRGTYDAILLDVDNGPEGLTRRANDGLYDMGGLARARAALTPGGLLAVWSANPHPAFARRFAQGGFTVEELRPHAGKRRRGTRHVIWIGTRTRAA